MARKDGRKNDELRPLKITRNFIPHAEGSALIELGNTKVICTATIEEKVPPFLIGREQGWITAEYAMIPRATTTRSLRESQLGRPGGRTQEIQRLIGRSLRAIVDLKQLPEITIFIDTDVITADGGTRTAAITGSFVALYDALSQLEEKQIIQDKPLFGFLAAVSVGIVRKEIMLDLNFREDSKADVDMNVVMNSEGKLIEIQATAEKELFDKNQLDELVDLAKKGIFELIDKQKEIIGK